MAWSGLKSSEDVFSNAQSNVTKATDCKDHVREESLAGAVQLRDAARQSLTQACHEFVNTRRDCEVELLLHRDSMEVLAKKIQSFLSSSSVGTIFSGQKSLFGCSPENSSLSVSSDELRGKLQGVNSEILGWVSSVHTKLSSVFGDEEISSVYANALSQFASMFDGSENADAPEHVCSLQHCVPDVHKMFEEAFKAEQWQIDRSAVKTFPIGALTSVLHVTSRWLCEMLFKLDFVRTEEAVQADLDFLQNFRDPKEVIEERRALKEDIDELDDELIDHIHELSKCQRKNLPQDGVEDQINATKMKLTTKVTALQQVDQELWYLMRHFPEYTFIFKEKVQELLSTDEVDVNGLFSRFESLDSYEVDGPLCCLGQGARHLILLVKQGKERYMIKEFELTHDCMDHEGFIREISTLYRLEHPYMGRNATEGVPEDAVSWRRNALELDAGDEAKLPTEAPGLVADTAGAGTP
eukprot:768599-Hanusia_phi.AAC.3